MYGVVYWTVLCYYCYLVSVVLVILLHLFTFLTLPRQLQQLCPQPIRPLESPIHLSLWFRGCCTGDSTTLIGVQPAVLKWAAMGMSKGRQRNIYHFCSQFHHQGERQCTMAITMVKLEYSWAFPGSCATEESRREHLSNGSLSHEVHADNTNHFAAVLPQETRGPSLPPAPPFLTCVIMCSCHDRAPLVYPPNC